MTAVQQNTQAAVVTDGPTIVYQLPILAEKLDGPLLVVGYRTSAHEGNGEGMREKRMLSNLGNRYR